MACTVRRVEAATHSDAGHMRCTGSAHQEFFEYDIKSRRWDQRQMPTLPRERGRTIPIHTSAKTMSEIADKICSFADRSELYRSARYSEPAPSSIISPECYSCPEHKRSNLPQLKLNFTCAARPHMVF